MRVESTKMLERANQQERTKWWERAKAEKRTVPVKRATCSKSTEPAERILLPGLVDEGAATDEAQEMDRVGVNRAEQPVAPTPEQRLQASSCARGSVFPLESSE